ncbi:MAG: acyltransferase [Pedobacter sp.]|nr:MAG: acyltransferase [Pedobacter sp.]
MGFIRFLLAIGVVLCHTSSIYGFSPVSGNTAVQCFYIISGFYMTMILNEKYTGQNGNKTFYLNRALKIYPIYWTILFASIIWSLTVYKFGYPGVVKQYADNSPLSLATWSYLILSNIFIIGLDWIFLFKLENGNMLFTTDFNAQKPAFYTFAFNSIAWTVGLELLFYLIAPFIMRKNILWIVMMLLLSLGLRLLLNENGLNHVPWDYMFFPTQILFFMLGGLSYHLYKKVKLSGKINFIISAAYAIIIIFYYQFFPNNFIKEVFLFVFTALAIPSLFNLTAKSKIDRYLGDLSYPIYISQSLIIMVTGAKIFPKPFGWGLTAVILCIAAGIFLTYFVTRPIEKIRQKKINMINDYAITSSK